VEKKNVDFEDVNREIKNHLEDLMILKGYKISFETLLGEMIDYLENGRYERENFRYLLGMLGVRMDNMNKIFGVIKRQVKELEG